VHEDAPAVGSTVGPWLILERLASGSFGVVFLARRAGHPKSPLVALKMARWPNDPRFMREAELLQRCLHPSIPGYEDMGLWTGPEDNRYPYLVMELVQGLTLYDWLREQQRSQREVLRVVAQLAGALATAHARGAVHRDVKGDNIRVTAEGRAVLVDWGSGWFAGARPLTDTTAPPGTTAYRPPEQRLFSWLFRNDLEARWHSTASDDLYSLGVTLYRMVTGVYLPPLTDGAGPVEHREVLEPSALATVCPELETLILRLLSADRNARGTAEQLAREACRLAETPGPELDTLIVPASSPMLMEAEGSHNADSQSEDLSDAAPARSRSSSSSSREHRCRSQPRHEWLSWASAAMVGGLMVSLVMRFTSHEPAPLSPPRPWIATPEEIAQFAPDAGVGEEALMNVQDVPKAVLPALLSLGRPMPSKPFPGQRRPPCEPRVEKEIFGGCWLGPIEDQKPPCGDRMFDYEGKCFLASYDQGRQPTSGTP
jgi:eukaryotic-like serine/threonine-protein kinase